MLSMQLAACAVVADAGGRAVGVQRTRSGEEDQAGVGRSGGGVGVLGGVRQGGGADEGDGRGHGGS